MRPALFNLISALAVLQFFAMPALHAQVQVNPTPDQLLQIMRSQPAVDISAPATATASFDPPLVQPAEKSIYRVTFEATEVSVSLPAQIPSPPLSLHRSVSGQTMQASGGALHIFSTFNYDVRAMTTGIFTMPEFTAEVYGKPVIVPAAQLEVKAALPELHAKVRQLVMQTSVTNVFVGEAFDVSAQLPATPPNGVEGVSELQLNGNGFITDKNAVRQSIQIIDDNGRKVPAFIYETTVTPITAGPLKISAQGFASGMQFNGPVTLSGQVSISAAPPKYILLEAEPVTVNVRPLPAENELPGFNGLIGLYFCDPPGLATNRLKLGEPVQLTVTVRSRQNLNRLNPPMPPAAAGWQIFPATRGGLVPGAGTNPPGAVFKYTLIPVAEEVHATPAIPFSYFDPARGQYVDLTIPSLPITVSADGSLTNADAALMLGENILEPEKKNGFSRLAVAPGNSAGGLVPWQLRPWFPFFLLLPMLGFCGLWFWDRHRRFLEQHPEIVRRRQARRALRREMRLLGQAANAGNAAGFVRGAVRALQIAVAPHYPATPRALVGGDVLQILGVPERDGKAGNLVRKLFAAADAEAFAGQTGIKKELLAEKSAVQELLAKFEARL